MNKKVNIIALVVLLGGKLLAQDTSAVKLPLFEKKTERYQKYLSGQKSSQFDSSTLQIFAQNSISTLLASASPVFIKNYGQGQLASSSFRGAGAEHTQVLWNGINIQSPITGQTDFSLLATFLTDEVGLVFGGQSALNGSGAVGGSVLLQNATLFNKKIEAGYTLTLGSFNLQQHALKFNYGTKRYFIKARTLFNQAKNDYTFYNSTKPNNPLEKQTHAETNYGGALVEAGFNLTGKQQILLYYWYTQSNRNIPPSMASSTNFGNQKDNSQRILAKYNLKLSTHVWFSLKLGLISENINYTDSVVQIKSHTQGKSMISEADYQIKFNDKLEACFGVNYTYTQGINSAYVKNANRNAIALFTSIQYKPLSKLSISFSVREEHADSNWLPFTTSMGMVYWPIKQLKLIGQINKSYRLPTFNELYYPPGNLYLLPESGWMQELGVSWYLLGNKLWFGANAYNRLMNNWISWMPLNGSWMAQNLKTVSTKGIEGEIGFKTAAVNFPVQLKYQISYLTSINQSSYNANQQIVGKQLIYIPKLTHQTLASFWYKKMCVTGNLTYTGYRFTTTDNSAYLDDYFLLNAFIAYTTKIKRFQLAFQFQANNVFNTNYQVMATRAMPLRNFQLSTSIHF